MARSHWAVALGMVVAAACAPALGAPTFEWAMATDLDLLPYAIANDDLINGIAPLLNRELAYAGDPLFEYPFNPNGYVPVNNMPDNCAPSPLDSPNIGHTGFHGATPDQTGARLTDGIEGTTVDSVLADFLYPAAVFQFDLPDAKNIQEILVFSANEDPNAQPNGRVWQNYDVQISTDTNPETRDRVFTPLISGVKSAEIVEDPPGTPIGFWPNTNPPIVNDVPIDIQKATVTRVYDDAAGDLAQNVTSIRFTFWAVSNTEAVQWDQYLGGFGCAGGSVADPEDIDNFPRAFESSIIKEIDVIESGASACNEPPQDVNGDGSVDLTDYGAFLSCYNGPNKPYGSVTLPCECFDGDVDNDVDLSDYGTFIDCYNGPGKPPAC
jgi:hypothetical protein